ncbi:hypothetical protein BC834DRAFT_21299 [Gloeopeniophorella convolvens]|nr:hypothetical protein BC834DRAFT_21299 [Gloeopeniophorella convolvens]
MIRSLLSRAYAQVLDAPGTSSQEPLLSSAEDSVTVNLDAMLSVLVAAPRVPWQGVSALGSTLRPLYNVVHESLSQEFENAAPFFADLDFEDAPAGGDSGGGGCTPLSQDTKSADVHELDTKSSDGASAHDSSCLIDSAESGIPVIVITPCDTPNREASAYCWVPIQDACFGNRLVVPAHPVVNEVFPPLLARSMHRFTRSWEYAGGHWRVVVPSLEEQMRRGPFSRTLSARRRAATWHCR